MNQSDPSRPRGGTEGAPPPPAHAEPPSRAAGETTDGQPRDLGALILPGVLVLVGGLLVYGNLTMDEAGDGGLFGAKTFPWLIAGLCFVVAIAMTVQVLLPGSAATTSEPGDEAEAILDLAPDEEPPPEGTNWAALAIVVAGVVGFVALLNPLGWLISASLLFVVVAVGMGSKNYWACVLGGIAMASAVQLLFSAGLGIALPAGILG